MTIKGQTLAKFTYADTVEVTGMADIAEVVKVVEAQGEKNSAVAKGQWTLYVEGAFNDTRSWASIMLISFEGHKIHCALNFKFKASNN